MDMDKSEYELARERKIQENRLFLEQLGLGSEGSSSAKLPSSGARPVQTRIKKIVEPKKPPSRARRPVDSSYGVSFKNSTSRPKKKKPYLRQASAEVIPYVSTRTNEDRMALKGRTVITYDEPTYRNHIGTVTQVLDNSDEFFFTVTFDEGKSEVMDEEELDEYLEAYKRLQRVGLESGITNREEILRNLNRTLPPPPPPPQQVLNEIPFDASLASK